MPELKKGFDFKGVCRKVLLLGVFTKWGKGLDSLDGRDSTICNLQLVACGNSTGCQYRRNNRGRESVAGNLAQHQADSDGTILTPTTPKRQSRACGEVTSCPARKRPSGHRWIMGLAKSQLVSAHVFAKVCCSP